MKQIFYLSLIAFLIFSCTKPVPEVPEYPKTVALTDSIWGDFYVDCDHNPLKNEMVVIQRKISTSFTQYQPDPTSSDTFYTDSNGKFSCVYKYNTTYSGPGGQPSTFGYFMYLPNITSELQQYWAGANYKNANHHIEFILNDTMNVACKLLKNHTYTVNDTLYYAFMGDPNFYYKVGDFTNELLFSRHFKMSHCFAPYGLISRDIIIVYGMGWNNYWNNSKKLVFPEANCSVLGDTLTLVLP